MCIHNVEIDLMFRLKKEGVGIEWKKVVLFMKLMKFFCCIILLETILRGSVDK
jgi:hypothetical protein